MPWLQLNFGLARPDPRAHARALLARALEHPACADGLFFQRKSPDLRLRIRTEDPARCFRALWPELRALREAGALTTYYRSVYEPEEYLFGGRGPSEVIHDYFVAETAAWVRHDLRVGAGVSTVVSGALTRAVLEDLLLRCIGDHTEVWDAWIRLEEVLTGYGATLDEPRPPRHTLGELTQGAAPEDRAILAAWGSAHLALAHGLQGELARGRLRAGLRAVLVRVAMFVANRHGLTGHASRALANAEVEALAPERTLIPLRDPK